jgi:anaerobic selenocysteine-containing dehydrogenase
LEPAGITFNEFRKIGILKGNKQYRSYKKGNFATPSGKVEIYSEQLKEWGFDPLPIYNEPQESPFNVSAGLKEKYPLVFTSGKCIEYRHSGGRQITSLREKHPTPVTFIHHKTSEKLGISEGDGIYLETKRGRIRQLARLTDDIDPRVVWADPCWWFPEEGPGTMYGWKRSNLNILTDDQPPYNKEMGAPNTRGINCRVYKAE